MRKRFLIVLGFALFVAFLIVGGLSFFLLYPQLVARAEGMLREEGRSRARVIAASVADRCTEPMLDDDEFVLGLIVSKTAEEYRDISWIGVVDADGETIAHTDKTLGRGKFVLPPGIEPVSDGNFVSGFYGNDMNSLWASYPIVIRGARMGTVHLSMLVEPDGVGGALEDLRIKALLIYAGLGAASTCLVLLLSYGPTRRMGTAGQRQTSLGRDRKGLPGEVDRKLKEEAEIDERISNMKRKEKEMVARLKMLKAQADTHEKRGDIEAAPRLASSEAASPDSAVPVEQKTPATPIKKIPEKEKIEAIRRRIHELEERIRGD